MLLLVAYYLARVPNFFKKFDKKMINPNIYNSIVDALQDSLMTQPAVIIGLISNLIGSPLQDDIARTLLRMQQSGQDILYRKPQAIGGNRDCKKPHFTR